MWKAASAPSSRSAGRTGSSIGLTGAGTTPPGSVGDRRRSVFQNLVSYTCRPGGRAALPDHPGRKNRRPGHLDQRRSGDSRLAASGSCWAALYAFYKTRPELLDPLLKTDQTFPLFIAQQLPAGIVGLVIAGLFAASMSTLDSSLNSISAAVVTDFYRRFRPTRGTACLNVARSLTSSRPGRDWNGPLDGW